MIIMFLWYISYELEAEAQKENLEHEVIELNDSSSNVTTSIEANSDISI